MIKTTTAVVVVDNKAISGDNEVVVADTVKSSNSNRAAAGLGNGVVGSVANSDYYYKNFYVRNPNEIKIFENNGNSDSATAAATQSRDLQPPVAKLTSSNSQITSNNHNQIIQQRGSFSEQDSKEEFTVVVSNKLYNIGNVKSSSTGNEQPIRFRSVATVQPPPPTTFAQIDEHRPAGSAFPSETTQTQTPTQQQRVVSADLTCSSTIGKSSSLSTSSTSSSTTSSSSSSPSSQFSQLSLSSSSLSSLSSSSSTASTSSSSSASASSAVNASFIPNSSTSASLYVKKPPNFSKSVVTIKQKQPRMAFVAPLTEQPGSKLVGQPSGEPKLKVVQKPSGYNEIYNNYNGSSSPNPESTEPNAESPSPTTPSGLFDRQHQNRQSIVTIKRPGGQSLVKSALLEESKTQSNAALDKSEHDNQLTELISSGGVKNLRQKFLENVSKANSTNLSESDLLKIRSEDELNNTSSSSNNERESAKPHFVSSTRKVGSVPLKSFELKKCKSAMVVNEVTENTADTSDNSSSKDASENTAASNDEADDNDNVTIVSIAKLAIMGQRILAHPSHDPMKYGGSCDNLDFEASSSSNNLTSIESDDVHHRTNTSTSSKANSDETGAAMKANSLKIKISNRPSMSRKMQKFKSEMDISSSERSSRKQLDLDHDYPRRRLNDEKLEVVNFGEILDDAPPQSGQHKPSIEHFFDYKRFEHNYNTIKQAFSDLKKDNEFLEQLLGKMTSQVKETSAEVAQMLNGPESLTDSFDYETATIGEPNVLRPESAVSFIKVKSTDPAAAGNNNNDFLRMNSDFVRTKIETTLKAMPPPGPRLPRNSDQIKANKPVAVILAMEKRHDPINDDSTSDHQEHVKLFQGKPSSAVTLIRHKF